MSTPGSTPAPATIVPKRERNWDAYAAVIASFIGLLALMVGAYTAYLQRTQLRAQVWPSVVIGHSPMDRILIAKNAGTGPARIKAVTLTVDGKPVRTWAEMATAIGHGKGDAYLYSHIGGRVLTPGEQFTILSGNDNDAGRAMFADLLAQEKHRVTLIACVCSVLDDCWLVPYGSSTYVDVDRTLDRCPIAADEQFKN